MTRLTDRQQEVLSYIQNELNRTGIIPSTREMQAHFGFASQTAAMNHLRALEKKGMIRRRPGLARAVIVERKSKLPSVFELPILGSIPAGMGVEVGQGEVETVPFEPSLVGIQPSSASFALRVTGDSMEGAHIVDGDLAVLEKRPARDGDIVAALIDGEVTLKRLVVNQGKAFLKAENPRYPDLLPTHGLEVQGVLTGVVRKLGREDSGNRRHNQKENSHMTIKQGRKRFITDEEIPRPVVNRLKSSGLQRLWSMLRGERRRKPVSQPQSEQLRFW